MLAQHFLFAYACINSSTRSLNWNQWDTPFPHLSFIPFIFFFFSLSLLPFQSPTGIGFIFHFLRIRCFWLSHTWLPVNIVLARSSFMVIRYLPFSHVCDMKLIAFIKTFILDVHRTESRKEYRKGTIHEIPGIFFCCPNSLHLLQPSTTR